MWAAKQVEETRHRQTALPGQLAGRDRPAHVGPERSDRLPDTGIGVEGARRCCQVEPVLRGHVVEQPPLVPVAEPEYGVPGGHLRRASRPAGGGGVALLAVA